MKKVIINGNVFFTDTRTRYQEGSSLEDMENGNAYETAYLVYDEDGNNIWDTTNYDIVRKYYEEENKMTLKQFLDMYTTDTMVCINDNNLKHIMYCNLWYALSCTTLHNYEVVCFGFIDNEICIRINKN